MNSLDLLLFNSYKPSILFYGTNSKTCLKHSLKKNTEIGFQYQLSFNAGQKYCRMLQGEHSTILLTFIKLPFSIKFFVLSIFKWPLKTGFTVYAKSADIDQSDNSLHYLLSEYKLLKMVLI